MIRLKRLRENSGKTMQQVANDLLISKTSYFYYESGKRQMDYEILKRVSRYFNVSIDYLLENDTTSKRPLPTEIDNITQAVSFLRSLNLLEQVQSQDEEKIVTFAKMVFLNITNFMWK